jgi:penicillin-binding protein 1C
MTNGRGGRPADPVEDAAYAPALARLAPPAEMAPPTILYPVPGSEIFAGSFGGDGVALAASGGNGDYRWYVDGAEIAKDPEGGRPIWRPEALGFYDVAVVDSRGAAASAKVRVAAIE